MIDVLGYIIVGLVVAYSLLRAWLFVVSLFPSNQVRSNHGVNRETGPQVAHPETRDPADLPAAIAAARAEYRARSDATRAAEAAGLEDCSDELPILGRKAAFLVRQPDGSFGFRPLVFTRHVYGVDSDAVCLKAQSAPRPHQAPADGCDCGIYAVPTDLKIPTPETMEPCLPYLVTLLVELSGVVVEHEKGYRAEHQRVVEVQLPPCLTCGEPSEWLTWAKTELSWCWSVCSEHHHRSSVSRAELAAALGVAVTS